MRGNRRVRTGIGTIAVLMVAALLPITTAAAQSAEESGMFTPVAEAKTYQPPAHVIRSRTVDIDMNTLFEADGKAKNRVTIGEVTFNLFPDITYTGTVTDASKDDFATTWSGDLAGVDGGYFYMVVADGAFAAHFASTEGIYEVTASGGGSYRVVQIDQSQFVDHPPGTFDDPMVGDLITDTQLRAFEAEGRGVDSGEFLDIIVLYTPNAKAADGGEAAIRARIALALAETNQSYKQSKVKTRLRLMHVEEAPYTEYNGGGGIFSTALNDLIAGTNGLAVAHTLRNTYGADMVGMLIEDTQYCGLAAGILPGEALAFQVTARTCATGYYSFGHEFGHLQGAHHDAYVVTNTTYAYGHGWVNFPDRWRTVMAYNSECAALGDNCTRLQYWSNPNKNAPVPWGSDPMGGSAAKNYKVLDNSSVTVANWRKSKGNDFYSTFTNNNKGWGSVIGNWGVNAKGWFWSKGKLNTFASAYHSGRYGNLTFEASVKRTGGCTSCANELIIRGKPKSLTGGNDWMPSYNFQYNNDGQYSVYKVKPNGNVVALQSWTAHAAIKPGKWNKLKVVAVGSGLTFYINNQLVWAGSDGQLTFGQVGVGFYRDSTAKNKMMVDWAEVTTTATADLPADFVYEQVEEIEASVEEMNQSG